ncbi:hypothetical protein [Erysipelatoclostridium sp. An173]|uniref:hypothetical protein n=1 Tax=Erysipelatoclostridium sp. An173 TaxID=1965571 RepID=UPI0032090EC5
MHKKDNRDIYEYQFHNLYEVIRPIIGHSTIFLDEEDEGADFSEKQNSRLLFDIVGPDFHKFINNESGYCYWIEVYIIKIIKNLLYRNNIYFHENYYGDGNEQHSLTIMINNQMIEIYILFDIFYEKANWTDYDKLATKLIKRNKKADKINIYILRNFIGYFDLANLFNLKLNENEKKIIEVFELKRLFEILFSEKEYEIFLEYANEFYTKCNMIINYKTVVTPTKDTIEKYKLKKIKMLKEFEYEETFRLNDNIFLEDINFQTIYSNFIDNQMYRAMVSCNDFADSFISSEWLYDVYSNAMGDLDLTGIVTGYLKSVEQLLYQIVKFHSGEGIPIKTINKGFQPYIENMEIEIDNTLWSINKFVTSNKAKLAINRKIRGCIYNAIDTWKNLNRNGYFHKNNLYKKDNKIEDIRSQTILLYFLILGGINFNSKELISLGITTNELNVVSQIDEDTLYNIFKEWWNKVLEYDCFDKKILFAVFITNNQNKCIIHTKILNDFNIDKLKKFGSEAIISFFNTSHLKDLPELVWPVTEFDVELVEYKYIHMLYKYMYDNITFKNKLTVAVIGIGDKPKLIFPIQH